MANWRYETTTIAGKPFKVMKMGGLQATKMWPRLVRIITGALEKVPAMAGPAVLDLVAGGADKDTAVAVMLSNLGGIAGVAEEFCKRLPEDEVEYWCNRLFEGGPGDERKPATYGGKPILDAMEDGDLDSDAVWEAIQFALKVNYAAFRKGLAGLLAAGLSQTAAKVAAPETIPDASAASST